MNIFGRKKGNKKRDVEGRYNLLTSDSPFAIREAYKALRTNVIFSIPMQGSKCIGITSSNAGEGKSLTVLNLAISFGQVGKKVILVDCDMRKPTIASKMQIKGQPGLSELLVGQGDASSAIRHMPELGIDILPSGSIPPDATVLLESKQMEAILRVLREHYEYIFIDMPPITTVADATILAKYLDGFLTVIRYDKSKYREVSAMLNQIHLAGSKILGFVCNDMDMDNQKHYQSYYKAK